MAHQHSSPLISPWLWIGVAPAIVLVQIIARAIGDDFYQTWIRGELGITETLTVVFLIFAVFYALRIFSLRQRVASGLFGPFALVMALGCFYFAGEEASWGQHWIGFATPEGIAERNEQGEFNLHNDPVLEGLLDNLPRLLLTIAALVGGILAPLVRKNAVINLQSANIWGWIWPTIVCLPTCVVAVFITMPSKLFEMLGTEMPYLLDIAKGETKEFCLALFLMLYLLNLYRHLQTQR